MIRRVCLQFPRSCHFPQGYSWCGGDQHSLCSWPALFPGQEDVVIPAGGGRGLASRPHHPDTWKPSLQSLIPAPRGCHPDRGEGQRSSIPTTDPPAPPSAQPSPFSSFHEFRGSSGRGMQPTCGSTVHPEGSVPHLDLGWPQFKGQELQVYSLVPLADLSGGGLWGSRTQVVAGDISVNTSHCVSLQVPEREKASSDRSLEEKRRGCLKSSLKTNREAFRAPQAGLGRNSYPPPCCRDKRSKHCSAVPRRSGALVEEPQGTWVREGIAMVFRDPREGVRQDGGMQPPPPPLPTRSPLSSYRYLLSSKPKGRSEDKGDAGMWSSGVTLQGTEQAWKDGGHVGWVRG